MSEYAEKSNQQSPPQTWQQKNQIWQLMAPRLNRMWQSLRNILRWLFCHHFVAHDTLAQNLSVNDDDSNDDGDPDDHMLPAPAAAGCVRPWPRFLVALLFQPLPLCHLHFPIIVVIIGIVIILILINININIIIIITIIIIVISKSKKSPLTVTECKLVCFNQVVLIDFQDAIEANICTQPGSVFVLLFTLSQ